MGLRMKVVTIIDAHFTGYKCAGIGCSGQIFKRNDLKVEALKPFLCFCNPRNIHHKLNAMNPRKI